MLCRVAVFTLHPGNHLGEESPPVNKPDDVTNGSAGHGLDGRGSQSQTQLTFGSLSA